MGAIFLSNSEEESFEINFKAPRDNMFYKLCKVLGGFLFKVKFPLHLPSCICELVGEIIVDFSIFLLKNNNIQKLLFARYSHQEKDSLWLSSGNFLPPKNRMFDLISIYFSLS